MSVSVAGLRSRFALNDFALFFTLFPKALFTFRSHYFFAIGLGASVFSLRRWTPARLHSTLKLRDSSPGVDLVSGASGFRVAPQILSVLTPSTRSDSQDLRPPRSRVPPRFVCVSRSTVLIRLPALDRTTIRMALRFLRPPIRGSAPSVFTRRYY